MEEKSFEIDQKSNQKVGSKSFLVVVTALISIFATIMTIYLLNDGVIFVKSNQYGDLSTVFGISEVIYNVEENAYAVNGELPTKEEMSRTAINAIINSLDDPYAHFFTNEEYEEYTNSVNGSFVGIGVKVLAPDDVGGKITEVFDNGPADEAGLQVDDIIIAVEGTSIVGVSIDNLSQLLQGQEGDTKHITILRDDKEMDFTLTLKKVHVSSVKGKVLDNNMGYLYITQFGEKTGEEFKAELDKLKDIDALIIDVRSNPGGYLDAVVDVADQILNSGKIVSVGNTLEDENLSVFEATNGGIDIPIALLINEHSASASEILAAAIKENDAGVLVGMTTYGKGIVQSTGKLFSKEGYLKLTTDAYYTPNGNNIHKIGVAPDYIVDLSDELKNYNPSTLPYEMDSQLIKAVQLLTDK